MQNYNSKGKTYSFPLFYFRFIRASGSQVKGQGFYFFILTFTFKTYLIIWYSSFRFLI